MNKKYDIVVFGATGFTGKRVVEEISHVAKEENLHWAVAGRTMAKLQDILSTAQVATGNTIEDVPVIIADINSPQSLIEMAQQTKVVLNCVGPYRFYGEPVVKACIEGGAHHLDISGEPEYLAKMQLLYDGIAREKNVFVIGAAAYDSVPSDLGVIYTKKQFGEGQITNVEAFLNVQHGAEGLTLNTGTMESAMHASRISSHLESERLMKTLFPEPLLKNRSSRWRRFPFTFCKDINQWVLPVPATDEMVVQRTQRELLANGKLDAPIQFFTYVGCKRILTLLKMVLFGTLFAILANFGFGRTLLMKFPHIFTCGTFKIGGPTEKQISDTSFTMEFLGCGVTDTNKTKIVKTKVSGPELAYKTTPICLIQSAVTLLKCQSRIQQKGGVLTPGAVFVDTDLIDRLHRHNVKFCTIDS